MDQRRDFLGSFGRPPGQHARTSEATTSESTSGFPGTGRLDRGVRGARMLVWKAITIDHADDVATMRLERHPGSATRRLDDFLHGVPALDRHVAGIRGQAGGLPMRESAFPRTLCVSRSSEPDACCTGGRPSVRCVGSGLGCPTRSRRRATVVGRLAHFGDDPSQGAPYLPEGQQEVGGRRGPGWR